jgi:hypothetical protein
VAKKIRASADDFRVPVRRPHPIAVAVVSAASALSGKDINGSRGTIRYGEPSIGSRRKFSGYMYPPQLFIGWDPKKTAAGRIQAGAGGTPGLPSTNAPAGTYSPLLAAMANVTRNESGGNPLGGA